MFLENNFYKKIEIMPFAFRKLDVIAVLLVILFNMPVIFSQHMHSNMSKGDSLVAQEEDFYQIKTIPIPDNTFLEVGGLAEMPDGRLAVVTRMGELWIIENPTMENDTAPIFKLFASGLHEPLGLLYKDEAFYVAQRAELTKISDTNGDGRADSFETITTWPLSGNYCEYNHGPILGPDGDFYINFNLGDNGMGATTEAFYGEMGSHVPWRGWMMKIDSEGKLIPYAAGLRSPAGIGTNASGDVFYTENQGGWVGTGFLTHVEKGDFFGHPSSLKSAKLPGSTIKIDTSYIPKNKPLLNTITKEDIPGFKMPSVRLPHGVLGTSLAGFVADNTKGGFGPFQEQLFVGDEGQANVMRVFLEKVNGEYQGVVFPFKQGFTSGILRMEWASDNSIYVGMSDRGWNSIARERYGLQRLVWTGKMPFEIKTIKAKPDGFELEFTLPVDSKTGEDLLSYKISGFDYAYQQKYGSDIYDKKECSVLGVKLSEDGLTARLIVDGLRAGYIHEIKCAGIQSKNGSNLLHNYGYYSLNAIPAGSKLSFTDKGVISAKSITVTETSLLKTTAKVNKHQTTMPSTWKNGPDITITIGVKPGLKYDIEKFNVKPNARVKLVFVNKDDMQHNLVVVAPKATDEIGQAALKLGLDGVTMNYVPKSNKVLYHTKLLSPGSSEAIYFTAPDKEGNYEYVCTYPGHYMIMRGIMNVSK